jgi:hypothetical protein
MLLGWSWMLDTGYSMLDARCSMLDAGYSMLDTRCSMPDTRYWMLVEKTGARRLV